ncbi:MAG TPA: hypothetical protein VLH86_01460 [Patescibacteria group bacterium]|nr:hypothetical protein [Patescibacteria group bacterium]
MSFSSLWQLAADAKVECFEGTPCNTGLPTVQATNGQVQIVTQIVFGVLGAVAVIFIIMGSIYMATAQGDPGKMARARQTIVFAAVGLAVALSAEAIVTFVVGKL